MSFEREEESLFTLGGARGTFSTVDTPFPLSKEGRGGGAEDLEGVEVEEPEGSTEDGSLEAEELGKPRLRPRHASSSSNWEEGGNIFNS